MEMENLETEKDQPKKLSNISPLQKKSLLAFICAMALLDFSGYGLPTTLYPEVALERGFSSSWSGVVLALFPFGGVFASFITGKVMRFYKKPKLLLIFLLLDCLAKFVFGLVDFIDDPTLFMIVSTVSRLFLGLNFMAFQTILVSLIPEAWPDSMVESLSYYELFCNCGLLSGPLFGSLIAYFMDFFSVFAILTAIHLVLGLIGLCKIVSLEGIDVYEESKQSLDMKKMLLDSTLMIQFFFQALFIGSVTFVSSGFETHIINSLDSTQAMCSVIYCLDMLGFCISLIFLNKIYKPGTSTKGWFMFGSITLLICNQFIGPNPLFGIDSISGQLISISISFFFVGISEGAIAVLMVPEYKSILRVIFPDSPEELLTDMAPGIYLAGYSFAECLQAFAGGFIIDGVGWEWASVVYSGVLLCYSLIYWGKQIQLSIGYQKMTEEEA